MAFGATARFDLALHDRTPAAARPAARQRRRDKAEVQEGDAATEYDALIRGRRRNAQRLQHAVKKLSPTQREVFALRVGEGLSYKEIADAVGCDGRGRAGALPQRDARCEGVSR